jgi:hypothetical protein
VVLGGPGERASVELLVNPQTNQKIADFLEIAEGPNTAFGASGGVAGPGTGRQLSLSHGLRIPEDGAGGWQSPALYLGESHLRMRFRGADPTRTELLGDYVQRIQTGRDSGRIDSGQHRHAPDQQQSACEQHPGRVKLNGPAEALFVDHENQ